MDEREMLKRLLKAGVVSVDERYMQVTDHEGYMSLDITEQELGDLVELRNEANR